MPKSSFYPKRWDHNGDQLVQILSDGLGVFSLRSNPDKTVTLNPGSKIAERTMPIQAFHKLGGIVGLYHEHVIESFPGPFVPYQ